MDMEQYLRDIKWNQYLLLILALWFFGLSAFALIPMLLIAVKYPSKNQIRLIFNISAIVFISYGIGKNLALYENAQGADCYELLECARGGFFGP
jgi:hypothetical protein